MSEKVWRFISVGDIHFDALRKYWTNHVSLTIRHLNQPAEYAIKEGVKDIVLLGDVGDGVLDRTGVYRLSERAQRALYKYLYKYVKLGLNFHIILGNHDHASHSSSTMDFIIDLVRNNKFLSSRVFIYDKQKRVKIAGIPVEFLPYPCIKPRSKIALCFGHFGVSGSLRDNGTREPGSNDKIYDDSDGTIHSNRVYVQGHLHTFHRIRNYIFPGTLDQKSFSEQTEKGWCDMSASTKDGKICLLYKKVAVKKITQLRLLEVRRLKDLPSGEPDPYAIIRINITSVNRQDDLLHRIQQLKELGHRIDETKFIDSSKVDSSIEITDKDKPHVRPIEALSDWLLEKKVNKLDRRLVLNVYNELDNSLN